jgi:hypothetical protein
MGALAKGLPSECCFVADVAPSFFGLSLMGALTKGLPQVCSFDEELSPFLLSFFASSKGLPCVCCFDADVEGSNDGAG